MRFDSVLTAEEADALVDELASLGSERRLSGTGLVHDDRRGRQFAFAIDEREQWWEIVFDTAERLSFHDGILDDGYPRVVAGYDDDRRRGPREFLDAMPDPLRMLSLRWMLTGPLASFVPVLVERLGSHSLLVTFQHVQDPPSRHTLVVDRDTGIAMRWYGFFREGTVLLSIDELEAWDPGAPFTPFTDWIRPDY